MTPEYFAELVKMGSGYALLGPVVVALWLENKQLRKDFDLLREKWQDKYDAMIIKTIEAINGATNQTNLFNVAVNNLIEAVKKIGSQ